MTFRRKSLLLFGLAFALVFLLFIGLRFWVLEGVLTDTDRQYAEHLHSLARRSFEEEQAHLQSTLSDWAYWDDTYDYLSGSNPGYVNDNLNEPALDYINVDLMVFYDTKGAFFHSVAYDHENKVFIRLKKSPENWLTEINGLGKVLADQSQVMGMVVLDEGPMIIAASPVLRNDYSGPPAGVMLVGEFVDQDFIEDFSEQVKCEVSFPMISAVEPSDLLQQIPDFTGDGEAGLISLNESGRYQTYSVLADTANQPILFLHTTAKGFFSSRIKSVTNIIFPVGMLVAMAIIGTAAYLYRRSLNQRVHWLKSVVAQPESQVLAQAGVETDDLYEVARQYLSIHHRQQSLNHDAMSFFNNYKPVFMVVDRNGGIQLANQAASDLFQVPAEQLIGRSVLEFSDDKQKMQEVIEAWPGQKTASFDLEINQGAMLLVVTSVTRYTSDGVCIGAFLVIENVTESRRKVETLERSESSLRRLVEESSVGIFLVDSNGVLIEWNKRMQGLFERSSQDVLGQSVLLFFDEVVIKNQAGKDFMNQMIGAIGCMMKGDCHDTILNVRGVDIFAAPDTTKHLGISIFPIHAETGFRMGGIITDITEQKQMEEAEKQQRIFIEALRDTSEALNSVLDFDSLLERILMNADRVVQSDAGAILLLENGMLRVVRSRGYIERGLKDLTESQAFPITNMVNMVQMASSGQPLAIPDTEGYPEWNPLPENRWVRSYIGMPLSFRDRTIGFLSLFHGTPGFYTIDHTERLKAFASQTATAIENARLYAELLHKADTDELTGLRNRRSFFELGGREVERAIRFEHPLSAMMIDLDYFKKVNDTFGHPVGDRLMVEVADQFRKNLRNVDLVARYGGDEFVSLLPENDMDSAMEVAKRLKKAIESVSVETAHGKAHVGVSIGVAELTEATRSLSALIESADRALYHAKQYGRSRVVKSPS